LELLLAVVLGPLLAGCVRRTKAAVAGRRGPPLLQAYRDLRKLCAKSAVYSHTTTWVFRAAPLLAVAGLLAALALAPAGGLPAALSFPGDFVLLVYLLAAVRFAVALAALDTGSSFEGMGASREMAFGVLAELALLLALASLVRTSGGAWSLTEITRGLGFGAWLDSGGLLLLVAAALFGILLVENARIPFDDPTTHLELTMIHEAMVLDHGGPDLAAIELASVLKLWLFAGLLVGIVAPVHTGSAWLDASIHAAGVFAVGVAVGLVESAMARLPLPRVPQILLALALLALLSVALAPDLVSPS
jgi:formate hydrogenlyase subunit 4